MVSAPSTYAAGTLASATMRSRSHTIMIGRRRSLSAYTPAMRPSTGNARNWQASSNPTWKGVALRMRIATVGSASALTWLPSSLMAWPHHSFRNSPSFQSFGWNTASYDAATTNLTSDLCGQLRVFLFADEVFQLAAVVETDLDEPAGAIWLGVDDVWIFEHIRIDLDDLTADRGLEGRGGVVGLHVPHAALREKHIAEVGQLQRGDLAHLVLEVFAEAQDSDVVVDPHPHVSVAEPQLGHTGIMRPRR